MRATLRLVLVFVIAASAAEAARASYMSTILASNPAAYWGFNENSNATTVADLSGNGFTATYLMPGPTIPPPNDPQTTTPGVPGIIADPGNLAAYFNGNLNAASFSTSGGATDRPLDELSAGPSVLNWPDFFSGEAWVRDLEFSTSGAVNNTARQIVGPDTMWGFGVEATSGGTAGRLHFVTFGKVDYYSPVLPAVSDGQWHQVGFTWDATGGGANGSRTTFYIDGVNVGFQDSGAGAAGLRAETNLDMLDIGRRRADANGQQWLGDIDELAIWHSLRTDADFANDYAAGLGTAPEPSTIALLAVGAVGLIGCTWRRRKRAV